MTAAGVAATLRVAGDAVCLYTALLLAAASAFKWRDLPRFEAALAGYRLLPGALAPATARIVAAAEAGVALGLLVPATRSAAALLAAALLLGFALAVGVNLLRGRRDIDCGCGGAPRPLSLAMVGANLATAAALAAAAFAPAAPVTAAGMLVSATAAGCAWLLHLAADQLSSTSSARGRAAA